jgi:hypothetical protein
VIKNIKLLQKKLIYPVNLQRTEGFAFVENPAAEVKTI